MPDSTSSTKKIPIDLDIYRHRRMVGYLGVSMPFLVLIMSIIRPHEKGFCRILHSVSSYYYTSGIIFFVGVLISLSLFFLAYRGYEGVKADRILGRISGVAAFGVAFFPTTLPGGFNKLYWWSKWIGHVHTACTVVLFISFVLFALWLFRKSSASDEQSMSTAKRHRNMVYLVCGIVMILCMVWILIASHLGKIIFWPEAIAIIAFSVSWLVKGKRFKFLND